MSEEVTMETEENLVPEAAAQDDFASVREHYETTGELTEEETDRIADVAVGYLKNTEDARDAFAWSDMALTRLFLDSRTRSKDGSCTRPLRAVVRLHRVLTSVLEGGNPDIDEIVKGTGYGMIDGRECITGGIRSHSIMGCDNLVRPRIRSSEVVCLGPVGFEDVIMPERRIELSLYLAAKALRG